MKQIIHILFLFIGIPLFSQINVLTTNTPATCPSNGTIKVDVAGGNPQYCYQLVGIPNTLTCNGNQSFTFLNLGPGNYTVRVSDNSAPPFVKDVTVNVQSQYEAPNIFAILNKCNIEVTATKGKAPYEFSLSNNSGTTWSTWQNSNIFPVSNLGDYQVRVRDACGSISPFNIKVDAPFFVRQIACLGTTPDSINLRVDLSGTFNDVTTKVVYGPNDTIDLGNIGIATIPNKCDYKLIIGNSCGFKIDTANPCKPFPTRMVYICNPINKDSIVITRDRKPNEPYEYYYLPSTTTRFFAVNGTDTIFAKPSGNFIVTIRCDGWKLILEKPTCNFKLESLVDSCSIKLKSICNNCSKGESTVEVTGGKPPYKFFYNIGNGLVANPNGISNPIFKGIPLNCAPNNIQFTVIDDCGQSKTIIVGCFNPLLNYDCKSKSLLFTGKYGTEPPPVANYYPKFHLECITCKPKRYIDVDSQGQLDDILTTDSLLMYDDCRDTIIVQLADPSTMYINPNKFICSKYFLQLLDSRPYKNCILTTFFSNFKFQILNKNNIPVDTLNYDELWSNFDNGEPYTIKIIDQGVCGTPTLDIVPNSTIKKFTNIKVATTSLLDSLRKCDFLYKLSYTGKSLGIIKLNTIGKIDTLPKDTGYLRPGIYKLLGDCDFKDTIIEIKPLKYPKVDIIQPTCPNGDKICINGLLTKTDWKNKDSLTNFPITNSLNDNYTFDCKFNSSNCPFRSSNCVTGLQKGQIHTIYIYPSYEGQNVTRFCPVDSIVFKVEPNYTNMTKLNVNFYNCTGGSGVTTLEVIGGTKPYFAKVKDSLCVLEIKKDSTKSNIFSINNLQTGQYCFEITDSCGNTVKFDNIKVEPSVFTVKYDPACKKDIVNIEASKLPGAVYTWTNKTTGAVVTPTVEPWKIGIIPNVATNTIYQLVVSYNGCNLIDTTFTVPPTIDFSILPTDTIKDCKLFLGGNVSGGLPPLTINWYNTSSPNTVVDITNAVPFGSYIYKVTDSRGCLLQTTINRPQPQFSIITNPKDSVKAATNTDVNIIVSTMGGVSPFNFKWDNITGFKIKDNTLQNPIVFIDSTFKNNTYTVTATDRNGCKSSATLKILSIEPPDVKPPTAFTPNGDGNNDYFRPVIKNAILQNFKIFNRWGQLLYEGSNLTDKSAGNLFWDGKFEGKDAPSDVYVFVLAFTNLDGVGNNVIKDTFTLLR
jgi:gliding motility-associated-like protein